jgi:hypothetical protein
MKKWFLNKIEITNLDTSTTWICQFNCCITDYKRKPSKINVHNNKQRRIDTDSTLSGNSQTKHDRRMIIVSLEYLVYVIEVFTGEKPYAGTDASIQISIRGSTNETRRLPLATNQANLFEQNQWDTFVVVGSDLGELLELT